MGTTRGRLRVGILTYDFYPFIGGQGRVTHDLWRRLRARGDIDISVISPCRNKLPGHHTRGGFTRRMGRHHLFSLLATQAAPAWARSLGLDVLHVNSGPGGVLLPRGVPVPQVCWPHHTYEQVTRLTPHNGWKSTLVDLERAAYAKADLLACTTRSTEIALRDRLRLDRPVWVIPCGVDFDAFPRQGRTRDANTILFVGRLDVRKGPDLLLRAFAMVARDRPAVNLVIVGEGTLEQRLRSLASRLGIEQRVTFERFVSQERLVERYNACGIVVVPSLFEGFGLSAVEAQSTGACVLATDSEGLRDVIIDGETGVLARRHPEAVAEGLLSLLADPGRRAALGSAAAEHVRRVYDWGPITERWVEAYRATEASPAAKVRVLT